MCHYNVFPYPAIFIIYMNTTASCAVILRQNTLREINGTQCSVFMSCTICVIISCSVGNKARSAIPASLRWTAPEILRDPTADESNSEVFTPSCDVYSYGMVLWEVVTSAIPFYDIDDECEVGAGHACFTLSRCWLYS